jgi:hypothetical protein
VYTYVYYHIDDVIRWNLASGGKIGATRDIVLISSLLRVVNYHQLEKAIMLSTSPLILFNNYFRKDWVSKDLNFPDNMTFNYHLLQVNEF